MNRDEFPKIKKGDLITDGEKIFCVLGLQNKPDFDSHGHHVGWINGFWYIDTYQYERKTPGFSHGDISDRSQ